MEIRIIYRYVKFFFYVIYAFDIWFCSMASRQVFEVPPTSVGGSLYSIGVCSRGGDTHKVSDWVLFALYGDI